MIQAIQKQIVRPLIRPRTVPGDLQLHVEREQLEVRLGQVTDQRQPHAAPRILGGEQRGAGRLVRTADATPDVEL